jgi:hypothetical protein
VSVRIILILQRLVHVVITLFCKVKHNALKTCGRVEEWLCAFFTVALVGGKQSVSCPGCFTPGERIPSAD